MNGGEHMCTNFGSHHETQLGHHPGACFCGCDGPMGFRPRFMTKEQKIERLGKYLHDLKDEAQAVEEHIEQIKQE